VSEPTAGVFTKYESRGAYHWQALGERLPNRYSARMHALYAWFVDEIRERSPATVVDIGCGDAALTHLMAQATAGRVVGVEPEPTGLELAQHILSEVGSSAAVILGRGESLPFESGTVDVVTLCEVVEHVHDAEPLLREAARVLAPNGAVLVSTPQWQRPELRRFHVREYLGEELAELLGTHFDRVEAQVSEPGRLQDLYRSRRSARIGLNVLSLAGLNPFSVRRPADAQRAGWRQLVASGEAPRRPVAHP